MKILKIRFENIHSLKGEHEIDFGSGILADAGLFAITGPTGSGKSTLLDVITLALYNQIARVNTSSRGITEKVLEDDGGIMTRNMRSCYAEVDYRANGKEYRSHWSIERNRNNKLRGRKQELFDIQANTFVEEGINTPKKNEEIIGLSYEQFVKAMVLSQGEFSKLLQAPRNERNKLLEDITGARSYRRIGSTVYQRFKGIEKEIELKKAGLESIELLSPEVVTEKQEELKALNEAKPDVEKKHTAASEKIKIRQELQKKQKESKALEIEKENLKEDLKVYEPFKSQLEKHDKLSKYAKDIQAYDLVVKETDQLKETLSKLKTSKEKEESELKLLLTTISQLVKEEVVIANATQKLETFRSRIEKLQADEHTKRQEASLHQSQLNAHVRKINQLGYHFPMAEKLATFAAQVNSFKATLSETIKLSGVTSLTELDTAIESQRKSNETASSLLTKKEQLLRVQDNLKSQKDKRKTAEENLKSNSDKIVVLNKDIPTLKSEVEQLEKTLEQQRKHQSLEAHRQQLIPDEPCPLCGSVHHPYAVEEPYFDNQEELLKEKKESLNTKSELQISLGAQTKFQEKEIANLTANIETQEKEAFQYLKEVKQLADALDWNYEEDIEMLLTQRDQLNQHIKKLEASKKAFQADSIVKDLDESLQQWRTSLDTYSNLNKQRIGLYEGEDINEKASAFSSKITTTTTNISSLKNQIETYVENLKSKTVEKTDLTTVLHQIVEKEQLENLEALRTGILPEDRARRIRAQEKVLHEKKTILTEKENTLTRDIKALSAKDDESLSFEALSALVAKTKERQDELLGNIGKITQILEADKKSKNRQQEVLNELKVLEKDLTLWKTMTDLIGDATGNKFSNFVQDLTLEQLIGYANKRLLDFSDRYLLDIPTADEAEKSDTLKVFDKYMGNARRSVHTLSGGETFLVSLAMAFALSDIAARNVKIESLFIDEGFGTLDPETLDQAITILEKMQNEGNRSVGIISHVGALKERITTQIQLVKGSLGYSTIEIKQ